MRQAQVEEDEDEDDGEDEETDEEEVGRGGVLGRGLGRVGRRL